MSEDIKTAGESTSDEPETAVETQAPSESDDGRSFFSTVKLVFALMLLAVLLIFALQNLENVNVDFLIWEFDIPQIALIILSLVLGITVWEVTRFIRRPRKQKS